MTESLPGSSKMNFRVFTSHIAVFPILIIFLTAIHLYLVHTFNFSPTPKDEWANQPHIPEDAMTARFDEHALRIFIYSALYYGALMTMAFFVRAPLADPPTLEHSALKPPWPYLWMYGFENIWGVVAVLFCSLFIFGFLALVPLLDRKRDRRYRARKPILVMGGIVAFALIGLSIYGKVTPAQMHTGHSHEEDSEDTHGHSDSEVPHDEQEESSDHHDAKPAHDSEDDHHKTP
jgi:quinol-cytochrome oxidoreductase complex cytochrome b subunit